MLSSVSGDERACWHERQVCSTANGSRNCSRSPSRSALVIARAINILK